MIPAYPGLKLWFVRKICGRARSEIFRNYPKQVRRATLAGIPAIPVDPGKVPRSQLLIDVVDILVPSGARGPSTRTSHRCG